jgi:fibronectin type 3 domain-containing protein
MELIDMVLQRRSRSNRGSLEQSLVYHPTLEQLEARECPAVAAPANLTLAALSSTQVKLNWMDVAGENGYRIYRWNGTQAVLAGTVGANVTTFTMGSLAPNQVQWFQVESFNLSSSARSAWASIKTPAQPIAAPTVNVMSTTLTQVTLTWGFVNGASGYRIFQWDGTRSTQVGSANNTTNAFTVQNLSPGLTYYFYVQAFNSTNSASSDWVAAATKSLSLSPPANVQTQVLGASTIGLSWTDAGTETGYRVYRWDGSSASSAVLIATLAANTTGYQATGLLPGKTYWFYVQAFNATAIANSGWVSATTTIALPLGPPTQLDVDYAGTNSVQLSWTEPDRAVGYRVYVWSGAVWMPVMQVTRGTNSVIINNLVSGRTHWFMVQSFTENFAEVAYSGAVFINL